MPMNHQIHNKNPTSNNQIKKLFPLLSLFNRNVTIKTNHIKLHKKRKKFIPKLKTNKNPHP